MQRRLTPVHFPVTDLVASQVLSLPTCTDMGPTDVEMVCELVAGLVEHGDEISERAESSASIRTPPNRGPSNMSSLSSNGVKRA